MVYLNMSVEDGDGAIHLIDAEEVEAWREDRDGETKLTATALCGHLFMGGMSGLTKASTAGSTIWKDQDFDPEDLADLILRLRRDGYMCRECVREHFEQVGGIPGLYHDKWTEDLHREESIEDPKDLKPVREAVEIEGHVTVMAVGDGLEDSQVRVSGQCPRCDDGLHVRTSVIKPRPGGRDLRVGVACTSCTWSRDVDLQP